MDDTFHVRRDERTGPPSPTRDGGSSLIEQLIAMSVIVAVLLGLLAALGATATSISTGRQRTIAVSLAKQAIENLQGAAYPKVATNTSSPGLSADPHIDVTTLGFEFENEPLVAATLPASPDVIDPYPVGTSYRTTEDEAGTTFSLRTFVTAVTPDSGAGSYRRITLIIDWNETGVANAPGQRTMRFSSLVFPLDYTSYPASSGSAEAIGASLTLTGALAGEQFGELRLALPSTHATTNSSTLRTSIASAVGSTSTVGLLAGSVASTCPGYSDGTGWECPRDTAASVADNDTGTKTGESDVKVGSFSAASTSTPKGTTVLTPTGTMTSKATVATCTGCGFDDADELPLSEAALTASGGAITFRVDDTLEGTLWALAGPWSQWAKVDHDVDRTVKASAQLTTPAARVFDLASGTGVPALFEGAVRVSGFTASASAVGGYTTVEPTATGTATVEIWDGSPATGYRTVVVAPGTSSGPVTAGFAVGDRSVMFTSTVESQPSTSSKTADSPRSRSVAQRPSLLLVTVDVTVTTVDAVAENFTIVFDYGRVSAGAAWLTRPT